MQQRNDILKKVNNYIDLELNPSKKTFHDSTKEDYEELKSIDEILGSLKFQNMNMKRHFQFLMTIFSDKLQKTTKFMFCV